MKRVLAIPVLIVKAVIIIAYDRSCFTEKRWKKLEEVQLSAQYTTVLVT